MKIWKAGKQVMLMSSNWDRQYRCTIGQPGKTGVLLGGTVGESGMPLHISFAVEKGDKESNNTATVKFWNLSDTTIAEIKKKNAVLELRAGYGSNLPLILAGDISTAVTEQENANMITTIDVVDGLVATRDTFVSLSFAKDTTGTSIIDSVANSMGVSCLISDEAKTVLKQKKFTNGFSAVGAGKTVLQKICKTCGLAWSLQNGVLQIVIQGHAITTRAYLLSAETGLLGIPKEITENSSSKDKAKKDVSKGYEVRYFMNGAIGIDDLVELNSKRVKGYFRVASIAINGDNFDGEWTCTAKLMEVAKK